MLDFLIGLVCIIIVAHFLIDNGRDDTDSPTERSGLVLYTDHKTGLQYVGTGWPSALVPRLDKDGKQMKIEKEEVKEKK